MQGITGNPVKPFGTPFPPPPGATPRDSPDLTRLSAHERCARSRKSTVVRDGAKNGPLETAVAPKDYLFDRAIRGKTENPLPVG